MKQCVTCGVLKPESEYNWRNKERQIKWSTCRDCQSKQRKKWYKKNKEKHKKTVRKNKKKAIAAAQQFIWDYLSNHPCVDCGETNPVVLEFDHVRGRKKQPVGDLAR